jgi:hypothetical protein
MTPEELARILYDVGFRGDSLVTMLAIAKRESGWRPDAHRSDRPKEDLSGDLGLFQINYTWFKESATGPLKKEWLASIGADDATDLFDPVINARAAYKISQGGTNLFPWSVSSEPGEGWSASGDPMNKISRSVLEESRAAVVAAGLGNEIGDVSVTSPAGDQPAQVTSPGGTPQAEVAPGVSTSFPVSDWLNPPTLQTIEESAAADGVMASPESVAAAEPADEQTSDGPPQETAYAYDDFGMPVPDWRDQFGYWWPIVTSDPDVLKLIEDDKKLSYSEEEFQARLEQTNWWKNNQAAVREWDMASARDPAEAQARITNAASIIRDLALDLNIRLSPQRLNEIARDSLRFGWTQQQATEILGAEAFYNEQQATSLQFGVYGNTIQQIANKYAVSLNPNDYRGTLERFATGQETEASLEALFQQRAASLYPALSEQIMGGRTVADALDPYMKKYDNIFGGSISAQEFVNNDELMQAVTYLDPSGNERRMTSSEWGRYLRTSPAFGYEYTDEAVGRAYQVVDKIASTFGAL